MKWHRGFRRQRVSLSAPLFNVCSLYFHMLCLSTGVAAGATAARPASGKIQAVWLIWRAGEALVAPKPPQPLRQAGQLRV